MSSFKEILLCFFEERAVDIGALGGLKGWLSLVPWKQATRLSKSSFQGLFFDMLTGTAVGKEGLKPRNNS